MEDRETGRSRGFAFVEMSSEEEATSAIAQFNGKGSRRSRLEGQRSQTTRKSRRAADVALATIVVALAATTVADGQNRAGNNQHSTHVWSPG
jgi:RNA recognition motif-containing protein